MFTFIAASCDANDYWLFNCIGHGIGWWYKFYGKFYFLSLALAQYFGLRYGNISILVVVFDFASCFGSFFSSQIDITAFSILVAFENGYFSANLVVSKATEKRLVVVICRAWHVCDVTTQAIYLENCFIFGNPAIKTEILKRIIKAMNRIMTVNWIIILKPERFSFRTINSRCGKIFRHFATFSQNRKLWNKCSFFSLPFPPRPLCRFILRLDSLLKFILFFSCSQFELAASMCNTNRD